MKTSCQREQEVLEAVSCGRWPEQCSEELRTHISDCSICKDVLEVAIALHADRNAVHPMAQIPSADLVWWRSELRARQEAIRTVSDLMKTIHGMEEDARHIRESLDILQQASRHCGEYIERWVQRAVLRYQESQRALRLKQKAYIDIKQQQKKLQDAISEKETRLAVNRARTPTSFAALSSDDLAGRPCLG